MFDLFSGFTQLNINPAATFLTTFCPPNRFNEWLRMPQGAAGAPVCFVCVILLVTAALDNLQMYLEDTMESGHSAINYVATLLAAFLALLRSQKLKPSPNKMRSKPRESISVGHVIFQDAVRPNDDNISALPRMPMPADIKQLRSLLDGLNSLPNMAWRQRPTTTLLKPQ